MISVFIALCSCHKFAKVTQLTSKNFGKLIDKRSNDSVWFVMFHGDHCPACRMAYPEFQEAAYKSGDMIHFGNVDTSSEQQLAYRFKIMAIPTFIVFHSKGESLYNGPRIAQRFLNYASKRIPQTAELMDETWIPNNETKEVVLLTSRKKAPPMWNSIASYFQSKPKLNFRIGYTNDPSLMAKFNVTVPPTIIMYNGSISRVYGGKSNFTLLKKTIIDFYNGKMPPEPKQPKTFQVVIENITSMEDFNSKCKGKSQFCVIQGFDEADSLLKAAAKKYRHDPFKFFTCGSDCPLKGVQKKVAIFHKSREQFIVTTPQELPSELDRIIDGTAPWKKYPPEEEL